MKAGSTRRRAWAEVLLTPLVSAGVLCLTGWRLTEALSGRTGLQAMVLALVLVLAIVYVTLLPTISRMVHAVSLDRLRLAMRAAGQRFILTLLSAGTIAWMRPGQRKVFLVWIAAGYVVITLAETVALVRWMRKTESKACS